MWIKTVPPGEAEGLLKRIYGDALARAGKVYDVVRIQSLRPKTLHAVIQAYADAMLTGAKGLTRAQREMLAVVTSVVNGCPY